MKPPQLPIDVILPVYKAPDETQRCLRSVLRSTCHPFRLLIIDDASQSTEIDALLEEVSSDARVSILRHIENRGYAATVNHGLTLCAGDVVLLNSDTEVYPGWLSGLHAASGRRHDIATVTPLTNFGSVCTLPKSCIPHWARSMEPDTLPRLAEHIRHNALNAAPEIPVGVGFCLYITRQAIDLVGSLDATTFKRGYGEEVDFCMRARRAGLTHVLDDTTFVFHRGGVSFGSTRNDLIEKHGAIIHSRYPEFADLRHAHEVYGHVRTVYRNLELCADMQTGAPKNKPGASSKRKHILWVLHRAPAGGGGIERHSMAAAELLRAHVDITFCFPQRDGLVLQTLFAENDRLLRLPYSNRKDPLGTSDTHEIWTAVASLLHPDVVHFLHLGEHGLELGRWAVVQKNSFKTVVSLRDFFLICPTTNLLDSRGKYCDVPPPDKACDTCLSHQFSRPRGYAARWRNTANEILTGADAVLVPNPSVLGLFAKAYNTEHWNTRVHEHGALGARPQLPQTALPPSEHDRLTVAFVGTAQDIKGYDDFIELARRLDDEVTFVHFGGLNGYPMSPHIIHHGAYKTEQLPSMLQQHGVHLVLMPGRIPETFSHVLTEVITARIPTLGPGIGAIGERVERLGVGWALSPHDVDAYEAFIRRLLEDGQPLVECAAATRRVEVQSLDGDTKGLLQLYEDIMAKESKHTPSETISSREIQLTRALASDNARLANALHEQRRDNELLRRRLGEGGQMELDHDDIQATEAYRLALKIRGFWRRVPYGVRNRIKKTLRGASQGSSQDG